LLARFGVKKYADKTRLARYTPNFLVKHSPLIGSKAMSDKTFGTL
jgi:hypothetical protein